MSIRKNLPNFLTILRLFIVFIIIALYQINTNYKYDIIFWLFIFATITDFFDGYFSRKFNVTSDFGRCLDPIADKIIVVPLFFILIDIKSIGVICPALITIRELLIAGIREFLSGREVKVHVSFLAKLKTAFQMIAIGVLMLPFCNLYLYQLNLSDFVIFTNSIGQFLMFIATALSLYTGTLYLIKNYKIIVKNM